MAKLANNIAQKSMPGGRLGICNLCLTAIIQGFRSHYFNKNHLPIGANPSYKKSNIFAFILLILLISSCKSSLPNAVETIVALQNLQELATTEYTVTKVVKANDNKDWYTIGDRKILLTCQAVIKAGIDIGQLQPENISVRGTSIEIHLPVPKILTVNLPPENIKVAYSDVGILRSAFTSAEKDALMAQAEKQMWAAGNELGIINQAKLNTQTVMNHFLRQLGFQNIELTFDEPPLKG
jgi:hypothetical protein